MSFSSNQLFTYSGLLNHKMDDFPKVIVTEEAKYFFARARLQGMVNTENTPTKTGQGLVGAAWIGKNEKHEMVVYVDLLPAFNKEDLRFKTDKYDVEYKEHEHAYTNEPLGGNSGRNHEKLLFVITARIQETYDKKNQKELEKYEGLYKIVDEKVVLDKSKLFGFGLFKGDDTILLNSIRNKSANINPHSIQYNPEFLLINYFQDDINATFSQEYFLTRSLPPSTIEKIGEALLSQLPLEKSSTSNSNISMRGDTSHQMMIDWNIIKNDPVMKNELLLNSLSKFCDMKTSHVKKAEDILFYLQQNLVSMHLKEKHSLSNLLNIPSKYNGKTPLMNAIDHNHSEIISCLIPHLEASHRMDILCYAIKQNNMNAVELILQKEIIKDNKEIHESLFYAASQGYLEMTHLLIKAGIERDGKNSEEKTLKECFSVGFIKLIERQDYHGCKRLMKEEKIDLNIEDDVGETPMSVLYSEFIKNIKKGNIENIMQFSREFPDVFQQFIYKSIDEEEDNNYDALHEAVCSGQLSTFEFIVSHMRDGSIQNKEQLKNDLLKSHLYHLAQTERYNEINNILSENKSFSLNDHTLEGKHIAGMLFKKFHQHVSKKDLHKFIEFKEYFPQLYSKFLNLPNNYGEAKFLSFMHKNDGKTAFMRSIYNRDKYFSNELLKDKNLEFDKPDPDGLTPLALAAKNGMYSVVDALLNRGAIKEKTLFPLLCFALYDDISCEDEENIKEFKTVFPDLFNLMVPIGIEKDAKRFHALTSLYHKVPAEKFEETFIRFLSFDHFIQKLTSTSEAKMTELTELIYMACSNDPLKIDVIIEKFLFHVEAQNKDNVSLQTMKEEIETTANRFSSQLNSWESSNENRTNLLLR
jgi:ankyrin repeat protein